jgi:serine/threonine-protein kinase
VNAQDRVGRVLDERYLLERLIGRGAMADVYQARDQQDADAAVAIKVLRQSLAREPEAVRRFEREVHVQGMIRHHNVAKLLGSGITIAGEPFLAVELLRGKSLRTVIKAEQRVAPARAASYTWQALQGLAAVHAGKVLHRDLKPANLMLEPSPGPVDRVVLIDFGFAALEGSSKLTAQGHVVGSLTYLAPERLRGEPGDERSDLYAMGVILFELLAGRPPFVGADDFDLINLHLAEPPPLVESIAPGAGVPSELEDVLDRALAKDADDRYATANDMADAIQIASQAIR